MAMSSDLLLLVLLVLLVLLMLLVLAVALLLVLLRPRRRLSLLLRVRFGNFIIYENQSESSREVSDTSNRELIMHYLITYLLFRV